MMTYVHVQNFVENAQYMQKDEWEHYNRGVYDATLLFFGCVLPLIITNLSVRGDEVLENNDVRTGCQYWPVNNELMPGYPEKLFFFLNIVARKFA